MYDCIEKMSVDFPIMVNSQQGKLKMRNIFNYSQLLKNELLLLLGFFSDIIAIITTVNQSIVNKAMEHNDTEHFYINIVFLSLAGIFILMYIIKNYRLERKIKCINLMAEYGHIHTLRMIVLRDFYSEKSSYNIGRENRFISVKSEFSFRITPFCDDQDSTILYHHKFDFKPSERWRIKDTEKFVPWIFGEDRRTPQQCMVRENNNDWEFVNLTPVITETTSSDIITEDVYKVNFSEWHMADNEIKHVEFKYERNNSFSWDSNKIRVFIIWPKCFMKKATAGTTKFEMIFEGGLSNQFIIFVNVYDCKKTFTRKESDIRLTLDKSKSDNEKTVYSKENIDLDINSVYAIYISYKDNNENSTL